MARGAQQPKLRRRVVAIFFIAILLPCLFLSYLGLKSIQLEKQWQRQLVLQNLRSSLALTIDRIESLIEEDLRSAFNALPAMSVVLSHSAVLSLQDFLEQRPIANHLFLLDGEARIVYPKTFRDESTFGPGKASTRNLRENESLNKGELLEAQGLLTEALAEFQNGVTVTTSTPDRLAFLARIARCEFKRNQFQNARTTYKEIIKEDQNRFYREEIPYVAIAYMQLLTIVEKHEAPQSEVKLLLEFYAALVEHFEHFDRGEFSFYLGHVKERLARIGERLQKSERTRLQTLTAAEMRIEDERQLYEMLQAKVIPTIRREVISQPAAAEGQTRSPASSREKSLNPIRYSSFSSEGSLSHIAWQRWDDEKTPIRVVGFGIRHENLDLLLRRTLPQTQESENIRTAILGNENRIVYPEELEGSVTIHASPFSRLSELLPGYRVAFVATGENPLETIAAKSLLIYYILVGSVIVFIVLGVVLMFRDISREERLSEMKSEFIANVSHEIKTPIATIRTLAENLTEGWVTDLDKQREYYRLLAREGERLSHLVENILDFSRIEARKKTYHREMVPVGELVQKSIDRFRLQVEGQGVELESRVAADLPCLNLDAAAIEQAILNLLDNAVKYSPQEKHVELSAQVNGEHVLINIADRGVGIERHELPRLFEKFYRIEPVDGKRTAGSGIGLTLVKEIVEAHGGRVDVESEVGKGSTFTLVIPIGNRTDDGNDLAR